MNIIAIIDETLFFLPGWLDGVISQLPPHQQMVCIVSLTTHHKQTWSSYLLKQLGHLKLSTVFKLGWFGARMFIQAMLYAFQLKSQPATISQVARKHHIKIIPTTNVNDAACIQQLKKLRPDIIISSCSQIFGQELLNLPKIACINRHSALLPSYGGVLPIFWALLHREKVVGVTIHQMTQNIDRGKIIFQTKIPILPEDTLVSLYKKSYETSVTATIKALEIIAQRKKSIRIYGLKPSYFSFPKPDQFAKFFADSHRFI